MKEVARYYITDGKYYVKKSKGKYITVSGPVLAHTFSYKEANNVIDNCLPKDIRKDFYLDEVNTGEIVKIEEVKAKSVVNNSDVLKEFYIDNSMLDNIQWLAEAISNINLPTYQELQTYVSDMEKAQSFYDQALADIDHWIMLHEPAAHIRTKVYGVQHDIEVKRAKIKETLRIAYVLQDAKLEDYTLDKLQSKIISCISSPYKPNTYVYKQLDDLLN